MFEDGVKQRAGVLPARDADMPIDPAIDVRKEEQLLLPLTDEPGKMNGTELVLRPW